MVWRSRDDEAIQAISSKYGNNELLTDLLNEGILPGTSINISGAKVVEDLSTVLGAR